MINKVVVGPLKSGNKSRLITIIHFPVKIIWDPKIQFPKFWCYYISLNYENIITLVNGDFTGEVQGILHHCKTGIRLDTL